ncbi:MAG: ABC transporter substrate-binding protein [Nitrososphaerales archaeon]
MEIGKPKPKKISKEAFPEILKERMSRREALSTGAKIGIAAAIAAIVAGVGGYFGGVSTAPTRVATQTITQPAQTITQEAQTITQTVIKTETLAAQTVTQTITQPAQTITVTQIITGTPAKVPVPSEPLRFGVMGFQTGSFAPASIAGMNAARIWADWVNQAGGILGRKVELIFEDETGPVDVRKERFTKLTVEKKVDAIIGTTATSTGLAFGPLAEQLQQIWISWDATTQQGLEETLPNPTYAFKSINNEAESVAGAVLTARFFPDIRTVAGINDDYSYGRNNLEAFMAILKRFNPKVELVKELWPKPEGTDYTSEIATLKATKADLIHSSFWSGHATIFIRQANAVGLFKDSKAALVTAGGVLPTLKKDFTPEGLLIGCNSWYFLEPRGWPLREAFVNEYVKRYNEFPVYECDHAFFSFQAYKAAVERAYEIKGSWPTKEEIAKQLTQVTVPSLSGYRSFREDHVMLTSFWQGLSKHSPDYDFIILDPVISVPPEKLQPPPGMKFHDWVKTWA